MSSSFHPRSLSDRIRMLSLALTVMLFCVTGVNRLAAQTYRADKDAPSKKLTFDARELARRYPVGKRWQSMSVFRADGAGSSTKWVFRGDVEILLTSRYLVETSVVKNQSVGKSTEIHLDVNVNDATSTKVFSKERLRLVDFQSQDPLFRMAVDATIEASRELLPPANILIRAGKLLEKADPNFERTLTSMSRKLGVRIGSLGDADDLQLIETADVFKGRQFRIVWTNGFGVTRVDETTPEQRGLASLKMDDLRRFAEGADPLAELYILPSLSKQVGDRWNLDASRAASVFVGRGDVRTEGDLALQSVSRGDYDKRRVRRIRIESGNLDVDLNDGRESINLEVDSMRGELFTAEDDGMLLMGNGEGDVSYRRASENHLLFQARVSRDFRCQWRHESSLVKP